MFTFLQVFLIPLLVFSQTEPAVKYFTPVVHVKETQVCTQSNPDWKEKRYPSQINYCQRNVSQMTKTGLYEKYGIPISERQYYTIDHIVPLSIGGTNHVDNLWPEHIAVKRTRTGLENQVYQLLRQGKAGQADLIQRVLDVKYRTLQ